MEFVGAKAALFCKGRVLTCQRDDRPGLRWAGLWDLPGGGREGDETAEGCFLRELHEEFGLRLGPDRLIWRRVFPSMLDPLRAAVFFGGHVTDSEVAGIRFGDEGQGWALMPVAEFLAHAAAVPEMQRRAAVVWGEIAGP